MPDLFPIFTHLPHPTPHAQLSLRYLPISFRDVFSRLLSHEKTHDMCFFTCLFAFTHSFLPATYPLASGVGFLACFSLHRVSPHRFRSVVYRRAHPKYVLRTYTPSSPTSWVSPFTFLLPRPVLIPRLHD